LPASQPTAMQDVLKPVVIYIVDDDEGVLRALARLVRACGFEAKAYQTPALFLQEVQDDVPACLLLDITMPQMTGQQVQVALSQRGITMPVIAVSARDDEETRDEVLNLGAHSFIRKPFDDEPLLRAIDWALKS